MLKYSICGTQSFRVSFHLATTRYARTDEGCRFPFFLAGTKQSFKDASN